MHDEPEEAACGRCNYRLEFCRCVDGATLDVERKAWAILAIAMSNLATTEAWLADPVNAEHEETYRFRAKAEREAVASARQALRDLGVDIDSLITEEA